MRIRFFSSAALQVVATLFVLAVAALILCHFGLSPNFNSVLEKQGQHAQITTLPPGAWQFIVSGDSRNCGDVVMPSIAAHSAPYSPSFYWHLGDFRAIYRFDQDYAQAHQWYQKAAEAGNYHAMEHLGYLYQHGLGVAQDYAQARQWYQKAADAGNAGARQALARLPSK